MNAELKTPVQAVDLGDSVHPADTNKPDALQRLAEELGFKKLDDVDVELANRRLSESKELEERARELLDEVLQQLRDSGTVEIKRYQLITKNAEEIERLYTLIQDLKLSNSDLVDKLKKEITEIALVKLKQMEADVAIKQKSIEEKCVTLKKETGKIHQLITRCDKLEAENEAMQIKMSNMVQREEMVTNMAEMQRKMNEDLAEKGRQLEDALRQLQDFKDEFERLEGEVKETKSTMTRNGCIQVSPYINIQPVNNNQWPFLQNPCATQVMGLPMAGNTQVSMGAALPPAVQLVHPTSGPKSTETGYESQQVFRSGPTSEQIIGTRQQKPCGKSKEGEEVYI